MKVADLRKPLPGNDIEVTTVTLEIERLIEKVSGMQDGVLDRATNPRLPGVFSPALHSRLCKLGHAATNAAALMRRLRVLCGACACCAATPEAPSRTNSSGMRPAARALPEKN